jgi:hypothetical protein
MSIQLSGYYEDFNRIVVSPQGGDYGSTDFYSNQPESHFGNSMAGWAFNNPRFQFDYMVRANLSKQPGFIFGVTSNGQYTPTWKNEGASQWLTIDPYCGMTMSAWEGRAQLTVADSIGDNASRRNNGLPRRADFNRYLSGWGTDNAYFTRNGDFTGNFYRASPKNDTSADPNKNYGKFQPGDVRTGTMMDQETIFRVAHTFNIAGVFLGEGSRKSTHSSTGTPYQYLYPIKSPAGNNFVIQKQSRRYNDWLPFTAISNNGSGKKKYEIDRALYVTQGSISADDKWYVDFRKHHTVTRNTSVSGTISYGQTTLTILAGDSPPLTPLDPQQGKADMTIYDASSTHNYKGYITMNTGSTVWAGYYWQVDVDTPGTGDITFRLNAPFDIPAVTGATASVDIGYWCKGNPITSATNNIQIFNQCPTGTPNPNDIFEWDGGPAELVERNRLNTKNGATIEYIGNIDVAYSKTQNGGSLTAPTDFSGTYGYPIWEYDVYFNGDPNALTVVQDDLVARWPFMSATSFNQWKVGAGDYLMVRDQTLPEKITSNADDGYIVTDAAYSATGTGDLRSATYGSHQLVLNGGRGREKDGLFGYQPVIVADSALNANTDGECFTLRMATQSWDGARGAVSAPGDMVYKLAVGYNKNDAEFSLNERGNMAGYEAAITHVFRPSTGAGMSGVRKRQFNEWETDTGFTYTESQLWLDWDIVVDFTNQKYHVFQDGALVAQNVPFNARSSGTWTAADFYGWSLGCNIIDGKAAVGSTHYDDWICAVTCIDRAAWVYRLSDRLDVSGTVSTQIPTDDFIVEGFKMKYKQGGASTIEVDVADDDLLLTLPQLTNNLPDWRAQLYRDNLNRPIWSGFTSNIEWKQNRKKKSRQVKIRAEDALSELNFQYPYWDIGQGESGPSARTSYARYEIAGYSRIFNLGAQSFLNLNEVIGFDEQAKDSDGAYRPRYDQRMRLYSGHPIQIYNNESTNGPNYVEDSWEISRLIDRIEPADSAGSKSRVVFTNDGLFNTDGYWGDDVKVYIKGTGRVEVSETIGGIASFKSIPEFREKGYINARCNVAGLANQANTVLNGYRGEWTTDMNINYIGNSFTATSSFSGSVTVKNATTDWPSAGTFIVSDVNGNRWTFAYTGKAGYGFTGVTTSTSLSDAQIPYGAKIDDVTSGEHIIIDTAWVRELRMTTVTKTNVGGTDYLTLSFDVDKSLATSGPFQFMPKYDAFKSNDSMIYRNDNLRDPSTSPSSSVIRIYAKSNTAGVSHKSALGDFPAGVFTSSSITTNSYASNNLTIVTTTPISALTSALQTEINAGAITAADIGDAISANTGYVTWPKPQEGASGVSYNNTGNPYVFRNQHARWIRDIPQSLWFQKQFGIIRSHRYGYEYGVKAGAKTEMEANFDTATDTTMTVTSTAEFPYAGIAEIWDETTHPDTMITSFAYRGKTATTLTNVRYINKTKGIIVKDTGARFNGKRKVACRDLSGDYKHIFILWADMRNDGSADADGRRREKDFGLLFPIQNNYKVSLIWGADGQEFCDLKIGEDVDIWSLNAHNDPAGTDIIGGGSTQKPWSDDPTATLLDYGGEQIIGKRSDDTEIHDYYKNWEERGGAFLVFDLSKFFNLNTESNNGGLYQSAGGIKPLGEILVESAGEPTLVDGYWRHAAASQTNSNMPIVPHPNYYRWLMGSSTIPADVASSTTGTLLLDDITDFDNAAGVNAYNGVNTAGKIEGKVTDAQGNASDVTYVFSWTGKTATSGTAGTLTGVVYRQVAANESVDEAAAFLWAGSNAVSGVPALLSEGTKIRPGLGSDHPMAFMLKIEGDFKSQNSGSYWANDKVRIYQVASVFDDWYRQVTMPALSDINNAPIMLDYNVDGNTAGAGTIDSFGSVYDGRNRTIHQTLKAVALATGTGESGSLLKFNYQMGRDNRLEFRPTYHSGLAYTRNNLKVSTLKASKGNTFTNVRVLYNGGLNFVDYPTPAFKTSIRLKVVNAVSVASYDQAYDIARQEYERRKEPAYTVTASPLRDLDDDGMEGSMLSGAKYGYVADPARHGVGPNSGYWCSPYGGAPFPGVCNALHGTLFGYGLLSNATYGDSSADIGIGDYTGATNYSTTYGPNTIFYPNKTDYWRFPYEQFYYWYGANSVSYAVQIVHIPKDMPTVSETTGHELRIFISDDSPSYPNTERYRRDSSADKKFKIYFADYAFENTSPAAGLAPKKIATQKGLTTINTLGNGYFEVAVPESYWAAGHAAGAKFLVSVNGDYLNALARHKTADKFGGNAYANQTTRLATQTVAGSGQVLPTFSNVNEFSIFPLGIHTYTEMSPDSITTGDYGGRSCWYAPRLHIVNDVNFVPGTTLFYTDAGIGVDTATLFYVSAVEWIYKTKKPDNVKLTLLKNESQLPETIENFMLPNPFETTGGTGDGLGGGGSEGGGGTAGRSGDGDLGGPPYEPPFKPEGGPGSWGPGGEGGGYTGGMTGSTNDTWTDPGFTDTTNTPTSPGLQTEEGSKAKPTETGSNKERLNYDTGVKQAGQEGGQDSVKQTTNNMSHSTRRITKGFLDLDKHMKGAKQIVPGQPKAKPMPPRTRSLGDLDIGIDDGQTTEVSDGWILPGASQLDDSEAVTNQINTVTLSATLPLDLATPVVGIDAIISVDLGPTTNKVIELITTVECPDDGTSQSNTITHTITGSSITREKLILFPIQYFAAASTPGRTLKVSITRKPDQGSDTADYSSVILHSVLVNSRTFNNQGQLGADLIQGIVGDEAMTLDLTGINVKQNTDPL